MRLNNLQQQYIELLLEKHARPSGHYRIPLDDTSKQTICLQISQGVFASDITSSGIYFARFLDQHQALYENKLALDMGCGAGLLGLVMLKNGAKRVDLVDINPRAVSDAKRNLADCNFTNSSVVESDLFESVAHKRYEFVVFNHPFFSEFAEDFDQNQDLFLRKSILGGEFVLKRFLEQLPNYLVPGGLLVMNYFDFAGPLNDPLNNLQGSKFKLIRQIQFESEVGFYKGSYSIQIMQRE